MKYYLKPHVTDEMLEAVGFKIFSNSWGYKWAVRNPFDNFSEITIVLHKFGEDYLQIIYFSTIKDVTTYIQDLIDLCYVEVRND